MHFSNMWPRINALCKANAVLIVACLLVIGGCSSSKTENAKLDREDTDTDRTAEEYPDFREPEDMQASVSFYGWLGDSAIMAEEVYTEDSGSYAEYYIFRPGADEMEVLDMDDSLVQAPGVVAGGIDVAPLHGMDSTEPFLELSLDFDSASLARVEGDYDSVGIDDDLPDPVGGLVGIVWHRPNVGVDTLWIDTVYVGPYYGETEVEYHAPEVNYAEMSPSRRSLMVALWLNDYIEYYVFDISRLRSR